MSRIVIEDLPALELLTEEQLAEILARGETTASSLFNHWKIAGCTRPFPCRRPQC